MNYEARLQLLRLENRLFVFWPDELAKLDLAIARHDDAAMQTHRYYSFGYGQAAQDVRSLRVGDGATLRSPQVLIPRCGRIRF